MSNINKPAYFSITLDEYDKILSTIDAWKSFYPHIVKENRNLIYISFETNSEQDILKKVSISADIEDNISFVINI